MEKSKKSGIVIENKFIDHLSNSQICALHVHQNTSSCEFDGVTVCHHALMKV